MRVKPCCEKVGLKKGPWNEEEDKKLVAFVESHGPRNWHSVPAKAGLQRCGKSCRMRWINYLNPNIKRGSFTFEEHCTIIQLHALLGNKWSIIAAHMPKRTDNDIKNYWNTNIKKRLLMKNGLLDPITQKSIKPNTFQAINISHVAQWESARIESEARESMFQYGSLPSHLPQPILSKIPTQAFHSSVISTSVGQFTHPESSLSYNGIGNMIEINSGQTQRMVEDGNFVSNFEDDDDVMIAVEAFRTERYESIQDMFDGSV